MELTSQALRSALDRGLNVEHPGTFAYERRRLANALALGAADLLALGVSFLIATSVLQWHTEIFTVASWAILVGVAWICGAALMQLLPSWGLGSVEELRRLTIGLTLVFVGTAGVVGLGEPWTGANFATLALAFLVSSCTVPYFRIQVKRLLLARRRWGVPAIIYGSGEKATQILEILRRERGLGYNPVGLSDGTRESPAGAGGRDDDAHAGGDGLESSAVDLDADEAHSIVWFDGPQTFNGAGKDYAELRATDVDGHSGSEHLPHRPDGSNNGSRANGNGSHGHGANGRHRTTRSAGNGSSHHTDAPVAVLAVPSLGQERSMELLDGPLARYRRVVVIPDLLEAPSLWVRSRDLSGVLGLEIRCNLCSPWARMLKRAFDVTAVVMTLPVWFPLCLLIMLLIWLEDRGSPFFQQERLGKTGDFFPMYKFRTMHPQADEILQRTLENDPVLREEWERNFKLRNDPRITRIGRILRRYSLDELPQLFNVLRGEMSLVGPRPLTDYHRDVLTARVLRLRRRVRPGMTGLWQVSGRADNGNLGMEMYDSYYVRNWSLWLDGVILFRTVGAVFRADGAY